MPINFFYFILIKLSVISISLFFCWVDYILEAFGIRARIVRPRLTIQKLKY